LSSRYEVWLVDDREENRTSFKQRHGTEWDVRTFERPDDVLTTLRGGSSPDALVCDIYFYDDPSKREEVEELVKGKAQELRDLALKLEPEKAQQGIGLIESIHERFGGGSKFPVFAYTSKGPYLLHDHAYDQLEMAGARWLFKGKYTEQKERSVVNRAIRDLEAQRFFQRTKGIAIASGIIGAVVGAVLGVFFAHFAHLWWGW
jgi:hypothetical protein